MGVPAGSEKLEALRMSQRSSLFRFYPQCCVQYALTPYLFLLTMLENFFFEDSGAIRGVNFPWKCSQGCAQLCKQGLGRQLTFLGNAVRGATGAQGTAWSLGMQPSVRSCDFCL